MELFFVLHGLINGERGLYAQTCSDIQLRDGWYWLEDGMEDPLTNIPFFSREDAQEGYMKYLEVKEGELA